MIIVVSYWWMKWIASIAYRIQGNNEIFAAQSIFIFIVLREKELISSQRLIHHERIHFKQQLELFFVGQWILYALFYFINLAKYKNHHQAYMLIPFEKEAYENDGNMNYIKERNAFAWLKYL